MKTQACGEFAKKIRIGIIGGSVPSARHLRLAETMGELVAKNGFLLVNGGLQGVMEASARGAKSHGGLVIGILPGKSITEANPFTDIAIPTGLGYLRNALVVMNSDILVAIDGAYGTLSEIAYAQVYGKTVIGIETWDIPGVRAVESPGAAMRQIIAFAQQHP